MKFQCLHCGQHYEVEDGFAGKSCQCQTCGKVMKIPVPIGVGEAVSTDTVVIDSNEIRRQDLRRKKHRYIRRILLVIISLLIGLVLGIIIHIAVQTSDIDSAGKTNANTNTVGR